MADYQNRVSSSFSERMRLNRFRRQREKSTFREEFRVIPRWLLIAVVLLYLLALAIGISVNLGYSVVPYEPHSAAAMAHRDIFPPELADRPVLASLALAGVITSIALFLGGFILLLGYVYRDAKRRGMHAGLWLTLILILSPAYLAIGFLLYFFLREPLPYPCPQCSATVGARFNFCPNCDTNLHPSCPQCRQEVSEADKFCPNCGSALKRDAAMTGATTSAAGDLQTAP